MAGLRELQKEQRRQAICAAALELFQTLGFAASSVEQIAANAGTSIPTLFKYFPSKQDILFALLGETDQRALQDARRRMPDFDDPVDTLCHFDEMITEYSLQVLPAAIWRELIPHWYGEFIVGLEKLNTALVEQIVLLLEDLKRDGKIRGDFDVEFAARVFNAYCSLRFMHLIQNEPVALDLHRQHIRSFMTLIFRGIHP